MKDKNIMEILVRELFEFIIERNKWKAESYNVKLKSDHVRKEVCQDEPCDK